MVVKAVMDRVFIRLDKKEVSVGGIILPESIESPRTIGVVESVGEEVRGVKVGDRVLFHVFDELPTYDEDVVVVREASVLGVFEERDV